MSNRNINLPAFPSKRIIRESALQAGKIPYEEYFEGMTLRDWFAGKFASNILSNDKYLSAMIEESKNRNMNFGNYVAEICYEYADAMLKCREESNDQ